MRYRWRVRGESDYTHIDNTITRLGASWILNQCFGAANNLSLKYGLISGINYGGVSVDDTITSNSWTFFNHGIYPFTPTLSDNGIYGNEVSISIDQPGSIAGVAIYDSLVLSVADFGGIRPVKTGDLIDIQYFMAL